MNDLFQVWETDLATSATGDLAIASGSVGGQQRVLRRLLTNPGDYIWHTKYGAGLACFVGAPANKSLICATIRSQIFKEPAVARTPEPIINVQVTPAGAISTVYVDIKYTIHPQATHKHLHSLWALDHAAFAPNVHFPCAEHGSRGAVCGNPIVGSYRWVGTACGSGGQRLCSALDAVVNPAGLSR